MINKNWVVVKCPGCKGEVPADVKECPNCAWIIRLIEKYHPLVGQFIDYNYNMAFNDGYSKYAQDRFIKEIESLEKRFDRLSPTKHVWFNWNNNWYKIGYAMRLVIEFKGTGVIKYYYPNGSIWYKLEYHNGKFIV